MKLSALIHRRLPLINLPGALLMLLLQRTPVLNVMAATEEIIIASPVGTVLKAAVAAVTALGAVNTLVGATPLSPSSGTTAGVSATTGTPVSVFYTVTGTQTLPLSWTITGSVPAGLDFSGLTAPGTVDVSSLHLEGTPSAAGTFTLTLRAWEGADATQIGSPVYNYTITVTGGSSATAPAITTQPVSQSVSTGSAVTFTVVASGSPAPTYQWKKGATNIAGATSASYMIASAATGDAGDYTVVATNSAGSATSSIATLTVNAATAAPAITTQPTNQTATAGGSVSFTVAVSGTPTPTVQWQKGNVNISGATSTTFTIASVAAGDAGNYTVVATNSAGTATSSIATLTVNAAASAPAITTQPTNQSAAPGSSVSFTVAVSGTPTPTLQWKKGSTNISGATGSTFTIASVATGDAGDYTVVATNSAGSVTSSIATLTVSATPVAPAITTQPTDQSVTNGSSVSFTVAASGSPTPTFQWQKGNVNISGATSSTYTIAHAGAGDDSTYTVIVTNASGTVTSDAATLSVFPSRLVNGTVTTGHAVNFSAANASGSIQWQVSSNGSTWSNLANDSTYSGVTSAQLSITNATAALNGLQYRYVATEGSTVSTSSPVSLTVAAVVFPFPTCITVDSAGNLFVGDGNADTIQEVNAAGTASLLAGTSGTAGTTDGNGAAARFNQPGGLVLLSGGTLIVADTANATLRSITSSGTVTTLAGSGGVRGNADGTGTAATFSSPTGISADASGNIFVADAMNDTIRKVTSAGVVTTFAGTATVTGFADGNGANARFNLPTGLTVDSNGNIYIADTTNNTIRKITTAGDVTTLAGVQNVAGQDDGAGGSALFNRPGGLAVDGAGNIYLTDTGNSTIRRITPAGVVTTIAGLPTIAGLEDGVGSSALFNHPQALCVDGSGNIFVADTGNAAIRKIDASGNVTTVAVAAATPPPPPPPPPPPSPPPTSPKSGGGGGGAPSLWFYGVLLMLGFGRRFLRSSP